MTCFAVVRTTWAQDDKCSFLSLKRWFQFNSWIVRTHFATLMTLNNSEMTAQTRSYIFRWRSRCRRRRVCVNSLIVKKRRPTWPSRRSYCWSHWIMSNSRRSTVLCFTASKNKRFGNYLIIIFITYIPPFPYNIQKRITIVYNLITKLSPII